ncbi:MAG: glycosyltransferase family 4 protein [Patescibacteria group bacterium]|nr:glycosyltransferase family 4 protein [Patescibacteria group bacterium]
MKLLIITQRVDINDSNLGFFHSWLEKFSERLEKVYVICLWQGEHNLPDNTIVYSMGKEKGYSKLVQLFNLQKVLLKHIREVNGIFIHMSPIYAIVSFPLAKIFGSKMILWFVHKSVNWKLKLAEKYVDKILTASKESCRLRNSDKIEIVGHGIDINQFQPTYHTHPSLMLRILSAGRIAPVKDLKTLIRAIDILFNQKNIKDIKAKIIGEPLLDSEVIYLNKLKNLVREKKLDSCIEFFGGLPHAQMPRHYQNSDLIINLSQTGSIDKTVLEAMASGCSVLTCNEAFVNILDDRYFFEKKNPQDLAEKIISFKNSPREENLREIIIKDYNLDNLIDKIISKFYVQH